MKKYELKLLGFFPAISLFSLTVATTGTLNTETESVTTTSTAVQCTCQPCAYCYHDSHQYSSSSVPIVVVLLLVILVQCVIIIIIIVYYRAKLVAVTKQEPSK